MDVLNWITLNPITTFEILVILVAVILLIYLNRKDVILKSALYIVAKVEEEWGSNMGKVKFAEAYTYLKAKYPIVTFLLPESVLKKIIEDALVKLKEILAAKTSKQTRLEAKSNQ